MTTPGKKGVTLTHLAVGFMTFLLPGDTQVWTKHLFWERFETVMDQ